ncbi:MAG: hypothetical protein ACTSX9_04785 [Candidatus Njordarchaeales archaeon]
MLAYVTLIAALIYFIAAIYGYTRKQGVDYFFWIISSLSFLIVAGALAVMGLAALEQPYTPFIGALYPAFLAIGILYRLRDTWWKYYLGFVVVMMILMAAGYSVVYPSLSVGAEVLLHTLSGLIIVFLPIIKVLTKEWSYEYLVITIGGIVIGIGGLALASIVAGAPILPLELVIALLHPILALSALLIAIGVYLIIEK